MYEVMDKLSIYISAEKLEQKPMERLQKLVRERDRSAHYPVVQALLEFLEREEGKQESAISYTLLADKS